MKWNDKVVLVTGGTGSFGKKFIEIMLKEYHPAKIIVFSRDELKQYEMSINGYNDPSLRYFLGDIRDLDRLKRAFKDVDIVVHAAALKQVPACEYNPFEAMGDPLQLHPVRQCRRQPRICCPGIPAAAPYRQTDRDGRTDDPFLDLP